MDAFEWKFSNGYALLDYFERVLSSRLFRMDVCLMISFFMNYFYWVFSIGLFLLDSFLWIRFNGLSLMDYF